MFPRSIPDKTLLKSAKYRSRGRLPTLTWLHANGASLHRCSQPGGTAVVVLVKFPAFDYILTGGAVGITQRSSKYDEELFECIRVKTLPSDDGGKCARIIVLYIYCVVIFTSGTSY